MGNFTITSSDGNDTASSAYSHQKKISFDDLIKDSEDFISLTLRADLSDVQWELNCKLKMSLDSTDNKIILDAIILNEDDVDDYDEKEWKLPYSTPLNYI